MAAGQGYFDAGGGWAEQPSNYIATSTWPAPTGTDPWGPPPMNPQNYSGGAMATAGVPIYATASVPVVAPAAAPAYPSSPAAPFDARNYLPFDPSAQSAGPFDARNYVHPDFTPMQSTYEPRTSESAFNNSMMLHGGAVTSPAPVVPPTYLYSPQLTSSRSGGSESYAYTQSPSGLSRSTSLASHPKERETWLYDRPGSWRPRFQMPRSGVGSIMQNFSRVKSFPPADTTTRTLDERIRFSALRDPPVQWNLRENYSRVVFRELKRPVTSYDLARFTTEPPTPYMRLFHDRLPWYIEVWASNEVGVTFYDLFSQMQNMLSSRISKSDFYNNDVTQEEREKISRACKERCQYNQGEMGQGVKKIDYLMRDCTFTGLVRSREGMWEIKTRKV